MTDGTQPADPAEQVSTSPGRGRGVSKNELTENYLPEQEDWIAKTVLSSQDDAAIAALKQMGRLYPEVEELQPIIDGFIHDFVRARTSIGGASRQEYKDILQSVHGSSAGESSSGKILAAMGVEQED